MHGPEEGPVAPAACNAPARSGAGAVRHALQGTLIEATRHAPGHSLAGWPGGNRPVALGVACHTMAASKAYDLLIVGGRVIDPGSKFDGIADVGVKNGKIAAVGANLPREDASEVFEAGGLLVTPGLVDTHVHV